MPESANTTMTPRPSSGRGIRIPVAGILGMLLVVVATPRAEAQMNLRMRVPIADLPAGVFLVYDACLPEKPVRPGAPYVAYWHDYGTQQLYIFGRVLFDKTDVAYALLNLERDLGADATKLAAASFSVADAMVKTASKLDDPTLWKPAIYEDVREVMDPNWSGGGSSNAPIGPGGIGIGPSLPPFSPIGRCLYPNYALAPVVPPPSDPTCDTLIALAFQIGDCEDSDKPPPPTGCQDDFDCDGIPDGEDDDIDGDGILNGDDNDSDNDGTPNGDDLDVDGDGVDNGDDPDVDGDGIGNGNDGDIDHDGIPNGQDDDMDGDGDPNDDDTDTDGDGILDGDDPTPNGCTTECEGVCCAHPTGACSIKSASDCTGGDFRPEYSFCDPNPCCPAGVNNVFPPSAATILQVPHTIPLVPDQWGSTAMVPIQEGDIVLEATCDGEQWCAVLMGVTGRYSQEVRLLSCIQEATGPLGNTTESNYCDQVGDLLQLGRGCLEVPPGQWYMIQAVQAHEDVHFSHVLPIVQQYTPFIESNFESICVPHDPGLTESVALDMIRSTVLYSHFLDLTRFRFGQQYGQFEAVDHGGPTDSAETVVVTPMADAICNHADNLCWPECLSYCPRPIGACCNSLDGACVTKTDCDCQGLGDVWSFRGEGTTCGPPNPCQGACCGPAPQHPCAMSTATTCNGGYRGDGTVCVPNPCQPPG